MAKSKPKKVKRPPPRVVVVNPWTSNSEHIAAWFELMLRDHGYPDTHVNIVFHRKNNGSKIVELPKEVKDVSMCLGTHYYSHFLKNHTASADFSVIYEYKNSYANDPGENNWTEVYPKNLPIPDDFPVKYPYPLPSPPLDLSVTSVDSEYACFPSSENRMRMDERKQKSLLQAQAQAQSTPIAPTSTLSSNSPPPFCGTSSKICASTTQSEPSPFLDRMDVVTESSHQAQNPFLKNFQNRSESVQVKKIDPYDEAEVAQELLRSLSPVKKSEADDFLDSVFSTWRTEEKPLVIEPTDPQQPEDDEDEDDYTPSAELAALISTLTPAGDPVTEENRSPQYIKSEPIETEIPEEANFRQEESATVPLVPFHDTNTNFNRTVQRHPTLSDVGIKVKPEPVDFEIPFDHEADSSSNTKLSQPVLIKQEQRDYMLNLTEPVSSDVRVKQEFSSQHYDLSNHPALARTRDPRLVSSVKPETVGHTASILLARTSSVPKSSTDSSTTIRNPAASGRSNKRMDTSDRHHQDRGYSPVKRIKTKYEEQ